MPTTIAPATADTGVLFPLTNGRRSTQTTARTVFAQAVRAVDADAARAIEATRDWHKDYARHLLAIESASTASPKAALAIARDGIAALHSRMAFARGDDEMTLSQALATWREPAFETATVVGEGAHARALAIPYRGTELMGDDLLRQLDSWAAAGVIEPSCADAVRLVAANPGWLDASDVTVALIGAGAEMGPLTALSRWGATVLAVDVRTPAVWERIVSVARSGCGRLHAPVPPGAANADDIPAVAGADLLTETPEIRTWLDGFDGPLVVGNYAYADGAAFVRVAVATDALLADLLAGRPNLALAYLPSPTDVYAVPSDVVEGARARFSGGPVARLAHATSAGRLYVPHYRNTVTADDGQVFGLADTVVVQQGPNYALAKRMQRWRALLTRESVLTTAHVAPATRTRSVLKNRVLAAAYAGAGRFGVEVFEPATSNTLMAALLIHDLRNPEAAARPGVELAHPLRLFTEAAAHGGVWRIAYEPRSVLGLAVIAGMASRSR